MVQRQHVNARIQFNPAGNPRGGSEKDILRRRQAVHRRGMMFGQMVGVEPRGIEPFDLS